MELDSLAKKASFDQQMATQKPFVDMELTTQLLGLDEITKQIFKTPSLGQINDKDLQVSKL